MAATLPPLALRIEPETASLTCAGQNWRFATAKQLTPRQWDLGKPAG